MKKVLVTLIFALLSIGSIYAQSEVKNAKKTICRIGTATNIVQDGPLYVMDGIPVTIPVGEAVQPEEIAKIEVLKGTKATAIYGTRGANGVIVITTKKAAQVKRKRLAEQEAMGPFDFVLLENPVSYILNFHFTLEEKSTMEASIYNLEGKELGSVNASKLGKGNHSYQYEVADLPAGIYILKVTCQGTSVTERFIIEK